MQGFTPAFALAHRPQVPTEDEAKRLSSEPSRPHTLLTQALHPASTIAPSAWHREKTTAGELGRTPTTGSNSSHLRIPTMSAVKAGPDRHPPVLCLLTKSGSA